MQSCIHEYERHSYIVFDIYHFHYLLSNLFVYEYVCGMCVVVCMCVCYILLCWGINTHMHNEARQEYLMFCSITEWPVPLRHSLQTLCLGLGWWLLIHLLPLLYPPLQSHCVTSICSSGISHLTQVFTLVEQTLIQFSAHYVLSCLLFLDLLMFSGSSSWIESLVFFIFFLVNHLCFGSSTVVS